MPGFATVRPRVRVIADNDYSGDPDGVIQLAHHLLCPSVDLRLVIGGQVASYGPGASPTSADVSRARAEEVTALAGRDDVATVAGSNVSFESIEAPPVTSAAEGIIEEAMRDDTDLPLLVACGGSLTNVAAAWLAEPRIAGRLTLVWIGGPEHQGLGQPPPGALAVEYNTSIDLLAAQVVFNQSDLALWQVPQDAYRQVLVSRAELSRQLAGAGPLGTHLLAAIDGFVRPLEELGVAMGETYVLGDSPLVLLTALLSPFFPAPSSCRWVTRPRPSLTDDGAYGPAAREAELRIYTHLDARLVVEDLYAKLARHATVGEFDDP